MSESKLISKELKINDFIKIIGQYYSDICHKNLFSNYQISITGDTIQDLNIHFEKYNARGIHVVTLNYNDFYLQLKKYADSINYELTNYQYCHNNDEKEDCIILYLNENTLIKRKIKD